MRWLDVLVHLVTFIDSLVENGFHHTLVACVEKDFFVEGYDIGYGRSEITRSDYANGFIR